MITSPAKSFTRLSTTVEAVQFSDTPENLCDLSEFMPDPLVVDYADKDAPVVRLPTPWGNLDVQMGDWIIKGWNGEFYPCKPDIFKLSYMEIL